MVDQPTGAPLTVQSVGQLDTSDPIVARYLKDRQEPHLYHYTSATALLNIVRSRTLWASRTDFTNDRLESQTLKERLKQMLEFPAGFLPWAKSTPSTHFAALGQQLLSDQLTFIASFSRHPDSLTQFRMYGPASGGYAIGFPRYFLEKAGPLMDCDYSFEGRDAWCRSYIKEFFEHAARIDDGGMTAQQINVEIQRTTDLFRRRLKAQLAFKANEFRAEDEARLYRHGPDSNWRVSADGSAVVPYHVFELPNEPVAVHMVCGPNRDPALGAQSIWTIMAAAKAAGTVWQFGSAGYSSTFRA